MGCCEYNIGGVHVKNNDIIETTFLEEKAEEALRSGNSKAEKLLQDPDKMERFLQRLEAKLKEIPAVGEMLSYVPTLVSMVRSYMRKEYTDLPLGTMIAIVSALLYFVSPVDIIPDVIPGAGYLDDAAVVTLCLKLVGSDVREYVEWREVNGKNLL